MSKIIMYSEAITGVTTTGDQYAFFVDESGVPTVKSSTQTIKYGTSGYAVSGSSGSSGFSGTSGQRGLSGSSGSSGVNGTSGVAGQGVPTGGTAGQVLVKVDGTNYNTQWVNQSGGGGGLSLHDFWSAMIDDLDPHPGNVGSLIPYSIRITANPSYKAVVQIIDTENTVLKTVYTGTTAPNPPTIPSTGLLAWYKADAGITYADGKITAWADQSGNGYNLIAPSGQEPNYGDVMLNTINIPNTIAGYSNKYMTTPGAITLPGETGMIFIVASQYFGEGSYAEYMQASFTSGFIIARDSSSNAILGGFGQNDSPYGAIVSADNDTFYTIRVDSDGTTSHICLNNSITGTNFTDSSSGSSDTLSIFGRSGGNFGKKAIAEILVYDYQLSETDVNTVETYLKNKWGHY